MEKFIRRGAISELKRRVKLQAFPQNFWFLIQQTKTLFWPWPSIAKYQLVP